MRRFVAILLVVFSFSTVDARSYRVQDVPNVQLTDRTRFVSNPDGILSADAVATLDSICYSLRERGLAELAIVAVDEVDGGDPFSFGIELFEKWGVGDDKLDNGLGILLVEDMHEIRFFTGYGLEGVLPDARCTRIQRDYMLPYFREDDYSSGMVAGLRAVDKLLTDGELPTAERGGDDEEEIIFALIFVGLCLLLPIMLLVFYEYKKTKCPKCGKHKLRLVNSSLMSLNGKPSHIVETYRCEKCGHELTRTKPHNDNDNHNGGGMWVFPMGGGFGGRGGGFGGGGFGGGFGGGSFGGGGGGSRW